MNGDPTLRENYEQVLLRIDRACRTAGRRPGSVRLLAVSKTFPATKVLELASLGQRAFGENYLQEALDKIATCRDERSAGLEWHFIGPIQSNKTRPIAENFDWVHSVDRERIARRLAEQRPTQSGPLNVCVQVNVSGESSKSGVAPADTIELARICASLPGLRLRGLTAIPESTDDVALQRRRFAALRTLHARVRSALEEDTPGAGPRPGSRDDARADAARGAVADFDTLSMGMSADLESAILEGATIVRIGTALFGSRTTRRPAS